MTHEQEVAAWRATLDLQSALDRWEKADSEDHFYGAWVGGSAASGGHPKGEPATHATAGDKQAVADVDARAALNGRHRGVRALGNALTIDDATSPAARRHMLDLDLVPPDMLTEYAEAGGTMTVGTKSYGAEYPGLTGHPRGWGSDKTWDDVPGAFDPATDRAFAGDRAEHGSTSIALHELGHGMDHKLGTPSYDSAFVTAWSNMKDNWRPLAPYYRQESKGAGREETWAEAFALHMKLGPAAVEKTFGPSVRAAMTKWVSLHGGA